MATKKTTSAAGLKFSKDALLKSERFCNDRDILSALLRDDQQYSTKEVENKIENYMKGEVK